MAKKSATRDNVTELFRRFAGQVNTLTIPRPFIDLCNGDHLAALLLSQILYWSDRTDDKDGWFSKSYLEWHEELAMTEYQVKRAVNGDKRNKTKIPALIDFGVETKLKPSNFHSGAATLHYRVNIKKLQEAVLNFVNNAVLDNVQNAPQTMLETPPKQCSELYTETTTETKTEKKPRAKSPEVVASKSVRYPDNIWTWQQLHIDAYYAEHAADLDALACAWDKMYKRFTELPLVEERSGVEVYKELCRQGIAPTEYSALITHTRRARTWQDRIRIGDLMRELSSFKAKARRSNIISLDPSMDLNKPVDITPILMRGTEEEAS